MYARFGDPAYNLSIALLRAAGEIVGQHRVVELVLLLLFVVVRTAGELAETRVVCLRGGA